MVALDVGSGRSRRNISGLACTLKEPAFHWGHQIDAVDLVLQAVVACRCFLVTLSKHEHQWQPEQTE